MHGFVTIFKSRAFKISLMIGLFITSALIILAMLLGNAAGNFVIQVESGDLAKSIAITDKEDDKVYTNRLVTPGMVGMTNTTPRYFLGGDTYRVQEPILKKLTEPLGQTITDETVYIYTFYIVNTGTGALNINLRMNYSNVEKEFDEVIRVLTYNEEEEDVHIYQKADTADHIYQYYPFTPEPFENTTTGIVYNERTFISATAEGSSEPSRIKYSVFFWIEGQDPECDARVYDGTIKFSLDISIVQ